MHGMQLGRKHRGMLVFADMRMSTQDKMVEISRTGPQGPVYRRGEKNNTAERQGRNAQDWETVTEDLRQLGEKLLLKTSGNMKQGKETWWWNEDVQESIQTKEMAKITLDKDNNEENKAAYKTAKKEAKNSVAIAKERAYDCQYADMDTTE